MYSKYEVKCKDCEDIITLIYDSREEARKEIRESVTCKCGKLKASPDCCSYSYNREGNPERVSYEMKNLKEDYFVLDHELQEKYEKVKVLAETLGFKETKYEDEVDGEGFVWYLALSYGTLVGYADESIDIKFRFNFKENRGWSEYKIAKFRETTLKRFDEFYRFLLKAKEDPKILSDKKYLWETNEFEFEGNREQHKSYDYEFWF